MLLQDPVKARGVGEAPYSSGGDSDWSFSCIWFVVTLKELKVYASHPYLISYIKITRDESRT